jgi:DNA-directed RNA polymerase specialized sigma24 family protein
MDSCFRAVPVATGSSEKPTMALTSRDVGVDPAEQVARIASARRGRLLRVHRRRLRWEDLEDCYSQATLELVARSRRAPFLSNEHVLNALEQKFLSRIEDRRRAISGRSAIEAAIARSVPVDAPEHGAGELEDRRAAVESQVIARTELRLLREVIADLNRDQQLVLASQVCVDMGVGEFCARFDWSVEKYRKVAQRARGKLRVLVEEYERGDRCRRLEPDLLAMSAGTAERESLTRARAHVANCPACSRMVGDLDRAARSVAALLPAPGAIAVGGGLAAKLAAVWAGGRRAAAIARHPLAETGAAGGAGVAGGGVAGVGALKLGLAAVCVAGAVGSYGVCARLGVLPGVGLLHRPSQVKPTRERVGARRGQRSSTRPATPARESFAPTVVRRAPVAPTVRHPRVRAVVQVRREFGVPSAHAASRSSGALSPVRASAAGASSVTTARATKAQVSQTQTEFGFEK